MFHYMMILCHYMMKLSQYMIIMILCHYMMILCHYIMILFHYRLILFQYMIFCLYDDTLSMWWYWTCHYMMILCYYMMILCHHIQFLKRSTFAHRAFTMHSRCLQRAFIVLCSACTCVHHSQSVQRSLTVRLVTVHKTFIVGSSLTKPSAIFIRNSNME